MNETLIFWDADTYHDVSIIQENWADTIIQKRKWTGKENLLDAGVRHCGLDKGSSTNSFPSLKHRVGYGQN